MNVPIQKWPKDITGAGAVEIARSIEGAIRRRTLGPGQRLPTVRALAARLRVSPATAAAAYRELRLRGLLMARGRRGTAVASAPPLAARAALPVPAHVRDLANGSPDPELLPPLRSALDALRTPGHLRLYGEERNLPTLLTLARRALEADGIPAEHLAVTSGALDGIERVLAAQLRPGDRVAVEDPGFTNILDLMAALGLVAVPVPVDDAGLVPAALAAALSRGLDALILTPRAQNPTGAALDPRRARELRLVLADRPELLVIEDDHAGPVAGVAAQTLCDRRRDRFAVVRSISKSLGPDLRLAFVAGDAETIARVEGRQGVGTGWVSWVLQRLVARLLADRDAERSLARAARTYNARRGALLRALAENGIEARGRSGLNVWIPVREEARAVQILLDSGWAVTAGERFRSASPAAIRVTIARLPTSEAPRLALDIARAVGDRSLTAAR